MASLIPVQDVSGTRFSMKMGAHFLLGAMFFVALTNDASAQSPAPPPPDLPTPAVQTPFESVPPTKDQPSTSSDSKATAPTDVLPNPFTMQGDVTRSSNPLPPPIVAVPQVGSVTRASSTGRGSIAPNMIGDFFGIGGTGGAFEVPDLTDGGPYGGGQFRARIPTGITQPGSFVGRQLVSENTSPIPRTRIFMNYSHFDSVPLIDGGTSVNRYTPGFEYAFLDNQFSIELRAPFAKTLESDINLDDPGASDAEFGNLTLYLKALLWNSESFFLSTGLGLTAPTANNLRLISGNETILEIENQSVHLMPFVGSLWVPNDRVFVQSFLQVDVDANGNNVNADQFGQLQQIGRFNDQTFLYYAISAGYWLFKRPVQDSRWIKTLSPIAEFHYRQSLQDSDFIATDSFSVGGTANNITSINAVFGLTALFNDNMTGTIGYATPLGGDKNFNGELRLIFNWYPKGLIGPPPGI